MKTVIFDLDGTLALIDERRAISAKPNGKINWKTSSIQQTFNWINRTYRLLKWLKC